MAELKTDAPYYGDNLDILRRYVPAESVDLVYLDPPFNSSRDYNVIFKDESGRKSDAQLVASEDTFKIILDASFGPEQFRSDITWKRTNVHSEERRKPDLPPFVMPTYKEPEAYVTPAGEQTELFGKGA